MLHQQRFSYLKSDYEYENLSFVRKLILRLINEFGDKVTTEEWYYLVETNTVYLDFEPSEGALIEVGYVIYSD